MGAGFASTDRFLAELRSNKLRPGYLLIGDEIFLYERCRRAVDDFRSARTITDELIHVDSKCSYWRRSR